MLILSMPAPNGAAKTTTRGPTVDRTSCLGVPRGSPRQSSVFEITSPGTSITGHLVT